MSNSFLSAEFLSSYDNLQPRNKGILFSIIFTRTYSRWVENKKRRETWQETIERVVNYNVGLYSGFMNNEQLIKEAELMYDMIFHLEVFPAGRSLWIGGTESAEKFGESNYNCAGLVMHSIEAFGDLFHLLLCGCGVGFRVLEEDVDQIPQFNIDFNIIHDSKYPHYFVSEESKDKTYSQISLGNQLHIKVGDSREGWVEALRIYLEILTAKNYVKEIHFDYSNIRPAGARIKTFGGRAPGPSVLREMFTNLTKVIKEAGGILSPIDVVDINNFIAKNVIIGGTRRSSQIALGSPQDCGFVDMKKDMWIHKTNLQRTMSNNSVVFNYKPPLDQIEKIFEGIKNNGEPGFLNLVALQNRRPWAETINPCGEAALADRGFCNLTTINLKAFVENGTFNHIKAIEAIKLATRIGLRTTNIHVSLPKWDHVQKRDRLLGVSMTGIMDAFDELDWKFDSYLAIDTLKKLREAANSEADKYAFEMRVPRPLLVTVLKPEGTISQLPTVSSGLHRSYAPHFIRRIRVSSMDPVAKALIQMGVPYEQDEAKSERFVFSFPIKTAAKYAASAEPARKQLQRYLVMQHYYTDHNSSCTLTVGEEEWGTITKAVHDHWDQILACAFLPKHTTAYPQMPYEEITQQQYEEMMKTFPNLDNLALLVNQIENEEFETDLSEEACSTGACPIR